MSSAAATQRAGCGREEGLPCPCSRNLPSLVVFRPSARLQVPPTHTPRPRNQADNPSRGRPPRVCSPHDVRPGGQWPGARVCEGGGSKPHNGRARGHMSPIRARSLHCPLPRPRRVVRVSTIKVRPHAARCRGGPRSQGWLRGVSRRSRARIVFKSGVRAHPLLRAVTLCGAARRARGHRPGARGRRATPGARMRGRAEIAELSALRRPARRPASCLISAQESC